MDNKQLIIIVVAIIVAGCIVASAVLFASSNVETVNTTVANNTTNSSLANNTTSEVVSDSNSQSSQSSSQPQQSQSSDIQVDPASYNAHTLHGYDSEGNTYYMWDGEWRTQDYMNNHATLS